MTPINASERKRKLRQFSLYYGLSVVAICLIVLAFSNGVEKQSVAAAASFGADATGDRELVRADAQLHRQFAVLQSLEAGQAAGTASTAPDRNTDTLGRSVQDAERAIRFSLDSLGKLAATSGNEALRRTLNYFEADLLNRPASLPLPRVAAGQPGTSAQDALRNNPEIKEEILRRDIRIADMEAEISALKKSLAAAPNRPVAAAEPSLAADPAEKTLRDDYEALQKNYKSLAETNNRLRNSIINPPAQQPPAAAVVAEPEVVTAARNRAAAMEMQLKAINADLSFSTVDCNLSRADVNQIIYNGKQRKALLQQALGILTALKGSADPEVQRRAMQKIGQLNKIATTVRD